MKNLVFGGEARVFLDAFAECVAGVAMARKRPSLYHAARSVAVSRVSARHGHENGEKVGPMFDRLWGDMRNPRAATK